MCDRFFLSHSQYALYLTAKKIQILNKLKWQLKYVVRISTMYSTRVGDISVLLPITKNK